MSDLISRKLAIELLENTIAMTKKEERRRNYCVELIKAMPSAEPVRHGKWIETDEYDEFYGRLYRCSNCNTFVIEDVDNYCSYCGARMDEE